jgi:hypothetical protein
MLALLYKLFALALLFVGGYLTLRYGMNMEEHISRIVGFIVLPIVTLFLWAISYRGKKFK